MEWNIALAADRVGWEERRLVEAFPLFGMRLDWVNDESMCLGDSGAPPLAPYDAVLIRSRSYVRGGLVATLCEAGGALTVNSASAVRTCQNKADLRTTLRAAGVPVPDFRLVLSREDFDRCLRELPLPLVLKPVFGGMGRRITVLRHADAAPSVYDFVEDLGHGFEQACLMEPYLGRTSLRCLVVGDRPLGAAEFTADATDWRSNAALGHRARSVPVDLELRKILDTVTSALGPGVHGVDLFRTPDGYVVNEVNHAPGFRALALATGADIPSAVARHVREVLA